VRAAALAVIWLGACGASRPATMPAASTASTSGGVPTDPKAEIATLDRKLADERAQLGLAQPELSPSCTGNDCAVTPMSTGAAPIAADPSCHPSASETCTSTCTLADAICDDSMRICVLADKLPGDTDAAASCSRAHATCGAAHARCCGCQT
jgi:hypothetical protein